MGEGARIGAGDIVFSGKKKCMVIELFPEAGTVGIVCIKDWECEEVNPELLTLVSKASYTPVALAIGEKVRLKNSSDMVGVVYAVEMGKPLPFCVGWPNGYSGAYSSKELVLADE